MLDQLLHELRLMEGVAFAALLSALAGWEREAKGRPAGLRTHTLVGAGSALLMVLGVEAAARFAATEGVRVDPLRVMQAVLSGVAFIGAGTIVLGTAHQRVRGLTTAASLLATSAVGLACGLGLYVVAAATTLMVLGVLRAMSWLERHGDRRRDVRRDGE